MESEVWRVVSDKSMLHVKFTMSLRGAIATWQSPAEGLDFLWKFINIENMGFTMLIYALTKHDYGAGDCHVAPLGLLAMTVIV